MVDFQRHLWLDEQCHQYVGRSLTSEHLVNLTMTLFQSSWLCSCIRLLLDHHYSSSCLPEVEGGKRLLQCAHVGRRSSNGCNYQGRTKVFGKESAAGRALREKRAAAAAAPADKPESASEKNSIPSQEPEVVPQSLPHTGGN